jgi:hypothetical protein
MKKVAMCLVASVGFVTVARSQFIDIPFHMKFWSVDEIAVGRVVAIQEQTIDVEVHEWMRDTTGQRPRNIRIFRYSTPSDAPTFRPPDPYDLGSRYLLFMRKPYDEGGGLGPYPETIFQLELDGSGLCFSGPGFHKVQGECAEAIDDRTFLDALRSFERCFLLQVNEYHSNLQVRRVCTDRQLRKWSARSPLHEYLARSAMDQIERTNE